MVVSVTSEEMS